MSGLQHYIHHIACHMKEVQTLSHSLMTHTKSTCRMKEGKKVILQTSRHSIKTTIKSLKSIKEIIPDNMVVVTLVTYKKVGKKNMCKKGIITIERAWLALDSTHCNKERKLNQDFLAGRNNIRITYIQLYKHVQTIFVPVSFHFC